MYKSKVATLVFVTVLLVTSLFGCQQNAPSTAVPAETIHRNKKASQ